MRIFCVYIEWLKMNNFVSQRKVYISKSQHLFLQDGLKEGGGGAELGSPPSQIASQRLQQLLGRVLPQASSYLSHTLNSLKKTTIHKNCLYSKSLFETTVLCQDIIVNPSITL